MKKFLLIAICFLMIVLSACSSDETSNISDEVTSNSIETDSTATKQETINMTFSILPTVKPTQNSKQA